MHFNREGNVYNSRDESLYNLTRVQPAPYWSTNHLLMKIQKDTQQKMKFVLGDENQAKQWERMSGAEEFKDNRLILTSPPSENGQIYLRDSENYKDVGFTAKLEGNVVGKQAIYLRYDRKKNAFIRLTLENNELKLEEKKPGSAVKELSKTKLGEVQWKPEDLAYDKATVYSKAQTEAGAPKEDEGYPINIQQSRLLDITLRDNQLSVAVDKQLLIDKQQIDATMEKGGLALEAQYSKQNKKDDIYDAIFTDMSVFVPTNGEASDAILFKNSYSGWDEVVHVSEKAFHAAIDWVIETF